MNLPSRPDIIIIYPWRHVAETLTWAVFVRIPRAIHCHVGTLGLARTINRNLQLQYQVKCFMLSVVRWCQVYNPTPMAWSSSYVPGRSSNSQPMCEGFGETKLMVLRQPVDAEEAVGSGSFLVKYGHAMSSPALHFLAWCLPWSVWVLIIIMIIVATRRVMMKHQNDFPRRKSLEVELTHP